MHDWSSLSHVRWDCKYLIIFVPNYRKKKLCRFKEKHMLNEVVIGFESTGPYAEPIANYLRKKPVKLVQVNPRLPESLYSLFQLNWRRTNFNTI
jgi:hypothetical protein